MNQPEFQIEVCASDGVQRLRVYHVDTSSPLARCTMLLQMPDEETVQGILASPLGVTARLGRLGQSTGMKTEETTTVTGVDGYRSWLSSYLGKQPAGSLSVPAEALTSRMVDELMEMLLSRGIVEPPNTGLYL